VEQDDGQTKLENAYKLTTPQDNVSYYDEFAATYDDGFAQELGYRMPAIVAETYIEIANTGDVPIADIGCGTGLVTAQISGRVIDGMDISPGMLDVSRQRGGYRDLYEVDLTGDISRICNEYGAVLSAGTFTHGHLGPDHLASLLQIARPGALFVVAVNTEHYRNFGFDTVMSQLQSGGEIVDFKTCEMQIYEKRGHDHSNDMSMILSWRRAS
jgi:SAM-dependent methyltransferase